MVTVEFASGYEADIPDANFDQSTDWWVEITQRVNPYDFDDEPVAVITTDGERIELDDDGDWVTAFESSSIWSE